MQFIDFAYIIGKTKKIKRSGWIRENIHEPESVAEHSFRLTVLAMVLAPQLKINSEKLIKMAITHDIAEAEIGDWVAERGKKIDKKLKQSKEKQETKIIHDIFAQFGGEFSNTFNEMLARKTKTAKIFWQLDKLEMAIQAHEYEVEQKKDLQEFFENAKMHVTNSTLKKILNELLSQRQ